MNDSTVNIPTTATEQLLQTLAPAIYDDQRVLTLAQIDRLHQRPEGTASRNFTEHRRRMVEGEDYYLVDFSKNHELRAFGIEVPPRGLTLVTESGYLLLVKSFTDELAWTVQRKLVSCYFRVTRPDKELQEAYKAEIARKVFEVTKQLNRDDAAKDWNRMINEINLRVWDEKERENLRIREACMINDIVLGMSSRTFRKWFGNPSDPIRDSMHPLQTKAISELEAANLTLLRAGMDYQQRCVLLVNIFERDHPLVRRFRDDTLKFIDDRFESGAFDTRPTHPLQSTILNPLYLVTDSK